MCQLQNFYILITEKYPFKYSNTSDIIYKTENMFIGLLVLYIPLLCPILHQNASFWEQTFGSILFSIVSPVPRLACGTEKAFILIG